MRICIDAGHGGHDSGAVAADGTREKDVVLAFAHELNALLAPNHPVLMTRKNDTFVGLSLRAQKSNDWGADVFLSIHANAALDKRANGAWFIHDDDTVDGDELAVTIFQRVAKVPGILDSDSAMEVYPDNTPWVSGRELTVISKTACPAVLVELGFLTNTDDLADLVDPLKRRAICRAIAKGVRRWGGVDEIEASEVRIVDSIDETPPLDLDLHPVVAFRSPVSEVQRPGETTGSLVDRSLGALVRDPDVMSGVGAVKRTIIELAVRWIQELLRKLSP